MTNESLGKPHALSSDFSGMCGYDAIYTLEMHVSWTFISFQVKFDGDHMEWNDESTFVSIGQPTTNCLVTTNTHHFSLSENNTCP